MPDHPTENNFAGVDLQRPFQGLLAFGENNKAQFGGRDAEINELFLLTKNNRLTIVFGKSGIGKTSVLQAGLMPELQKRAFFPIYFRIDYAAAKHPLAQVKDFVFEKLKSADPETAAFDNQTLWEYFHEIKISAGKVMPVLILDQFEETFTVGKEKGTQVTELIAELSDLAENRIPSSVYEEYQERDELIPSRYERQPYRVIIGLREDYLAQLESLKKYLPSIQKSRCRILQMTALQAMQSVLKSAGKLIDEPIAREIIKKLPGITDRDFDELADDQSKRLLVEPFLLSLICFQINEKRIEQGFEKFTGELVSGFDIKDVISSFYADALKNCDENVRIGVEESLLTESGYRKLASLEELQLKYKIHSAEIESLINKRLIRKEERDGVDYVELIHDVLVPVLKEKRENRAREKQEEERLKAIQQANEINRLKIRRIRKRSMVAGIVSLVVVAAISLYAYTKNAEANRLKNLEFARRLLVESDNAKNYGDDSSAALIARAAYLLYTENGGKSSRDRNTFYTEMLEDLQRADVDKKVTQDIDSGFYLRSADQAPVEAMTLTGRDMYSASRDGKVFRWKLSDSVGQSELFYDFNKITHYDSDDIRLLITKMSVSRNEKILAIGGFFPFIQLFDLNKKADASVKILLPAENESAREVIFDEKGIMYIRTGHDKLIMLPDIESAGIGKQDIDKRNFLSWKKRAQFNYHAGSYIPADAAGLIPKASWNAEVFSIPGLKFQCIDACNDRVVIGVNSGFFLMNRDSLIQVSFSEIGIADSFPKMNLQFDRKENYLYIGGGISANFYRVNLSDMRVEHNQSHAGRMLSMLCNADGNFLATQCTDGGIGIYHLSVIEDWKSYEALDLRLKDSCSCNSKLPSSMAFSRDNRILFAGYENGIVYQWPVSPDVLTELICSKINVNWDSVCIKYVDSANRPTQLNKFNCSKIHKQ